MDYLDRIPDTQELDQFTEWSNAVATMDNFEVDIEDTPTVLPLMAGAVIGIFLTLLAWVGSNPQIINGLMAILSPQPAPNIQLISG